MAYTVRRESACLFSAHGGERGVGGARRSPILDSYPLPSLPNQVVNSIYILSITGKVASCDGIIHIWNAQTGKLIAVHAESSISFPQQTASIEQANMLNQDALSDLLIFVEIGSCIYGRVTPMKSLSHRLYQLFAHVPQTSYV